MYICTYIQYIPSNISPEALYLNDNFGIQSYIPIPTHEQTIIGNEILLGCGTILPTAPPFNILKYFTGYRIKK